MIMMEAEHERHPAEEEEEERQSSSDEDYDSDEGSCLDDDGVGYDKSKSGDGNGELRQHLLAVLVAVLAAVASHAHVRGHVRGGGYEAWKDELAADWEAFRSRLTTAGGGSSDRADVGMGEDPSSDAAALAGYASAPSVDAIPLPQRRRALDRALGRTGDAEGGEDGGRAQQVRGGGPMGGGHDRARNWRRTRGLSFCPTNGPSEDASPSSSPENLAEMEFILPLDPGVRVLHALYLGDALGSDSGMVYDEWHAGLGQYGWGDLGSYGSDAILNEMDDLMEASGGEGLMLEQVESVVRSRLPESSVDRQHLCLLHQYALNKSSGRSVRGTTKVYERPHVSTFYRRNGNQRTSVPPASLSFTGYAAKFVNLSPEPVDLWWDGGRIRSGSRAGEMHRALVGTIPSMGSVGTASFPGHSFFVSPTYDRKHQLQRWLITEDDPVVYYDPVTGDLSAEEQRAEIQRLTRSGQWTERQRFEREAWTVHRSFARDYLVKTGRVWLANFPQPYLNGEGGGDGALLAPSLDGSDGVAASVQSDGHRVHMWPADYIGQTHAVDTSSLYYASLPNALGRLTGRDYLPEMMEKRRLDMRQYQSRNPKGKKTDDDNNTAMNMLLNAKVISVAPRVLEVKKFLSPVEVQHLISLASGTKGDMAMARSTVSASNVKIKDSSTKVRGATGDVADARTSTGGWIHREQDAIVDAIFCRVADLLNVDERLMRDKAPYGDREPALPTHERIVEAMQLLRYGPGEEYSAHHDFTYPSMENRYQPRRYATVLLYLTGEGDVVHDGMLRRANDDAIVNDDDRLQGGETIFPRAITTDFHDGVKVQAQTGKALLFYNILPDGNMDDLSQHAAGKVEKGVKYVANVWIWDPIVN